VRVPSNGAEVKVSDIDNQCMRTHEGHTANGFGRGGNSTSVNEEAAVLRRAAFFKGLETRA